MAELNGKVPFKSGTGKDSPLIWIGITSKIRKINDPQNTMKKKRKIICDFILEDFSILKSNR